jgi:hypothetical protein
MWAAWAAWLIEKFGAAVLAWSVEELLRRLESDGDPPPEIHGSECECHKCGTVFDNDELGIDPEGEGWNG